MELFKIFIKKVSNETNLYIRNLGENIKELLKKTKSDKIPVSDLAKKLDVKTNTIQVWKRQGIPISKLWALNRVYFDIFNTPINKGKILLIGIEKSPHSIKIPSLNKELAYLVGYLSGDGSLLQSKECDLRVEFDDISLHYLRYISNLVSKLFEIKQSKPIKDNLHNCYCLRFNSKLLALFFNKVFEIPLGKKKGKLHIPRLILNSEFIKDYIAGLIDAEGHIFYTPNGGYRISISQKDPRFLKELGGALKSLGLRIKAKDIKYNQIQIHGKNNFYKIISIFGLNHPDKLSRIKLAKSKVSTVKNKKVSAIKLKIISILKEKPLTSKELATKLGLKRRGVWRHLRELEKRGMLKAKRDKPYCIVIWGA